ncbi:unnamed protein product [Gongylonema pulchrum]|uniref:COesterase domain-containing protein n=1 Tax=Gongylonema pulchrum TaxID=637853 RepID=A0A183DIW8_9BILA|nr:unnamed protein product [Gongylonema pulchrum]
MKGDRANLHYPSLFSGDVASYDPIIKRILDGNESLENFRFGAIEKDEIFHRYFSDKVKKAWNENPERLWRRKELKPFADYIELSNFALTEDDLKVLYFPLFL